MGKIFLWFCLLHIFCALHSSLPWLNILVWDCTLLCYLIFLSNLPFYCFPHFPVCFFFFLRAGPKIATSKKGKTIYEDSLKSRIKLHLKPSPVILCVSRSWTIHRYIAQSLPGKVVVQNGGLQTSLYWSIHLNDILLFNILLWKQRQDGLWVMEN